MPEELIGGERLEDACAEARKPVIEVLGAEKGREEYKDAITGQPLRPDLVRAARKEEMEYFATKRVWTNTTRQEAFAQQGKAPITVKWIDVNKGDDAAPKYRSRLVAREVRRPWEQSILLRRHHWRRCAVHCRLLRPICRVMHRMSARPLQRRVHKYQS